MPAGYVLVSKIPQIIDKSRRGVRAANATSAKRIASDARSRAPRATGRLARSIEAKPGDGDDHTVRVGAWYGHFVEWGTVRTGARPFLTPAAEAERANHRKAIKDLYS